jgi:hypothetical protein
MDCAGAWDFQDSSLSNFNVNGYYNATGDGSGGSNR